MSITPPDHDANLYKENSSLQNSHAQDILKTVEISPQAKVLDVGCGDGRITAELAKRAMQGDVTGVDVSPHMIESASTTFSNFPNLHFQLKSIEEAEFSDPFDLITAFSCFHWLKEPKKIMQKLISRLKEGGELLILTYPKEMRYYHYLEEALKKYPEYKDLSANRTMLSAQEYKGFFEENKLKVLEFKEEPMLATYNSTDEIFNFIKGWVSNYVPIPEPLQDQFINDVIVAILDDSATRNGSTISVPYTALTMRIQK